MKPFIHQDIDEQSIQWQHASGLHVVVVPKKNYHKTYVTLSTPFGANHTEMTNGVETRPIPSGSAHFLEHTLFDRQGIELSKAFAHENASVNAYTQNDQTTFLFSCSNHLQNHLERLIDMVFHPVFTEEGIEKERHIIDEEIEMYEDNPYTVLYEGILDQMYFVHPIKHKILGTKDSLRQIDKGVLEGIHKAAYNPKNMILFIVGKVDIKAIKDLLDSLTIQRQTPDFNLLEPRVEEPLDVVDEGLNVVYKDVLIPHNCLGIKLPTSPTSSAFLKAELTYAILFEMVLGKSSDVYQKLIQTRAINDSFDLDITLETGVANVLIGCNLEDPSRFFSAMNDLFDNFESLPLDEGIFKRVKHQILGGFIHALNSLEYIANQYTKYYFQKDNLFDILAIMKTITLEDVKRVQGIISSGKHAKMSVQKKVQ